MKSYRKLIALSILSVSALILLAYTIPSRDVIAGGQPGGFLSLEPGNFVDSRTGQTYELTMLGAEGTEAAGAGNFTLQVLGPGISICSTHGGGADIGLMLEDGSYAGNYPLTEIQCGDSYGMAVSIDGCTAKTELHGYSHSDYPLTIYSGTNTVELTFRKTGASSGHINIKVYTPKGPIKLSGNVSGPIIMSTCQ
jgi:hypothetical protein